MVTHCALSAQHISKFAKDDPFVYVGDFNIKPASSMYKLLTEGSIDPSVRILLCSVIHTLITVWKLLQQYYHYLFKFVYLKTARGLP